MAVPNRQSGSVICMDPVFIPCCQSMFRILTEHAESIFAFSVLQHVVFHNMSPLAFAVIVGGPEETTFGHLLQKMLYFGFSNDFSR